MTVLFADGSATQADAEFDQPAHQADLKNSVDTVVARRVLDGKTHALRCAQASMPAHLKPSQTSAEDLTDEVADAQAVYDGLTS